SRAARRSAGPRPSGAHCTSIRSRSCRWRLPRSSRLAAMILENGVIRTLDPSLPESRALAIAGDRIAGGVGVHETALASPETVDLGGRCVLPGFTDAHVHFPTGAVAH